MDEVVEAIEKYHGLVPLVYDITTMSLVEARAEDMQYAVYLKREADKEITRQSTSVALIWRSGVMLNCQQVLKRSGGRSGIIVGYLLLTNSRRNE